MSEPIQQDQQPPTAPITEAYLLAEINRKLDILVAGVRQLAAAVPRRVA